MQIFLTTVFALTVAGYIPPPPAAVPDANCIIKKSAGVSACKPSTFKFDPTIYCTAGTDDAEYDPCINEIDGKTKTSYNTGNTQENIYECKDQPIGTICTLSAQCCPP